MARFVLGRFNSPTTLGHPKAERQRLDYVLLAGLLSQLEASRNHRLEADTLHFPVDDPPPGRAPSDALPLSSSLRADDP